MPNDGNRTLSGPDITPPAQDLTARPTYSVDDGPWKNGLPWAIVATDAEGASEIYGYFFTKDCADFVADQLNRSWCDHPRGFVVAQECPDCGETDPHLRSQVRDFIRLSRLKDWAFHALAFIREVEPQNAKQADRQAGLRHAYEKLVEDGVTT